jgi:hypothetical protein
LGVQSGSNSSASTNERHADATLKERKFNTLTDLPLSGGTATWALFQEGGLGKWGSEKKIQSFIQCVIVDAISAVGLKGVLECQEELSVFKMRPDIWIVTVNNGVPVGVIEVKRPDKKIMNKPMVHGQIYDYMLRLRSFHGLKNVFGIVTTYTQWRLYWLPDCDDIAAATSVNETLSVGAPQQLDEEEENDDTTEIDATEDYIDKYEKY